jgi:cyclopropane fatty-acyl-phospholipid synthase-like methyltransferase
MSLVYRFMYRIGFAPWDTDQVPGELRALVDGADALAPGRALDIGCGTGTQSVYLATNGWEVTAIDAVEQPLRRARDRAAAAGADVAWLKADVAQLAELGLARGFALFFDRGCFHGLNDRQRDAYAAAVGELAAPGATLLLMAFAPNRVPFGPGGASADEIHTRFTGWDFAPAQSDSGPDPGGPLRDVARTWYRAVRTPRS